MIFRVFVISSLFLISTAKRLPQIDWISSRPPLERYAAIGDTLDIICPTYNQNVPIHDTEQSIIYRVSEEEYYNCALQSTARELGRCTAPYQHDKLKVSFRLMSPNPSALDYRPGTTYYFISTSSGSSDGLNNQMGGLCASHNLKMIIHVTAKDGDINGHIHRHHHHHKKTTTTTTTTLQPEENKWPTDPLWGQFFEKMTAEEDPLWPKRKANRAERIELEDGDSKDAYESIALPLEEIHFQIHEIGDVESLHFASSTTSTSFYLLIIILICFVLFR